MTTRKNNKPIKTYKRKTVTKRNAINKRKTRKQRGGEGVKKILEENTTDFLQHDPPFIQRDWAHDNHLVQFPINDEYLSDWKPLAGDVKDEYADCAQNAMTFLRIIPRVIGKKISKHVNLHKCGTTTPETIALFKKAYPNDTFAVLSVDVSKVDGALKAGHATFLSIWFPLKKRGHSVVMAKDLMGKTWIIDGQKLLILPYREYLTKYKFISEVTAVVITTSNAKSELKRDITTALSKSKSQSIRKSKSIEPTKKRARISNSMSMDVVSPTSMDIESPQSQTPKKQTPVPMEID